MARLALFLLGSPRLERDGEPLKFDTRKIMALVAYLATSGQGGESGQFSRESLIALLWPELEPERARAVLRRNLSLLSTALRGEWLLVDRQTISLDPQADLLLDVDRFRRLAHTWQVHGHPQEEACTQCLADLEQAVALYHGDFLEGFSLRDSVAFDDWQFFQAEELRRELASALERLVSGYAALGNPEAALPHARRWLALDPLHEPAHRQLMQLYAQAGQRSAALRQYQECVRLLGEELGLPPSDETAALYEQIRSAAAAIPTGTSAASGAPSSAALSAWASPPCHNLPAQVTPFVGRERELTDIRARLEDPACRLLTLLGPGGVGKTRLALRLAEDLVQAGTFENGVFFVSLAPLQWAEGLVPAVSDALCCSFQPTAEGRNRPTPRQQLLDYLQRKQLLLVMDNFEHLLPDASQDGGEALGFIADVLSQAPGVKFLVTSRASLKVGGEHLYRLGGLRVPPTVRGASEEVIAAAVDAQQALRAYSAIELFVQGARQVRPDFDLRGEDTRHVARICRLVQGMPLAILLAAAWVEVLAPEEIAAEIRRSLDFLEASLRDAPVRQRSIRAVFDHSWRLLSSREQEIFQALSVFVGGCTRDAAQEVTGASLRELMSLVDKSFLVPSSPGRFDMHELLRQYAAGRLDATPDHGREVRDRHCAYYCAALERWAADLKGPRQGDALDELDLDIENGRAAWTWATKHGQLARLAQAADGMWLYHTWRFRAEEGEVAFSAAVRALETVSSPEALRLRARCLILVSDFHADLGNRQPGYDTVQQAMALLRELEAAGQDVRSELALALHVQARLDRYYRPSPVEARVSYEQSAALYEEIGDQWGLARAFAYLGWVAEQLGQFREAQALCERSLAIRRELGDRRGMADAMLNLGIISWVQGRLDEARGLLDNSLGLFRSLDDFYHMAQAIKSLGEVLVRSGQFEDGLTLLEASVAIYEDLGYIYQARSLLAFIAEARLHLGDYAGARSAADEALVWASRGEHRWSEAFAQFVGGLAALAQGDAHQALSLFQGSVAAFDDVRHRENRGWALGPLGLAACELGDLALAGQSIREALQAGVELGAFMPLMYGLPAAARFLAARGDVGQAVEVYACVCEHPFVAGSRWFQQVAGGRIAACHLPPNAAQAAQARGRSQSAAALATRLLADLT